MSERMSRELTSVYDKTNMAPVKLSLHLFEFQMAASSATFALLPRLLFIIVIELNLFGGF